MSGLIKPKKNIIWLASYPKSGNTWTRLFLENLYRDEKLPFKFTDKRRYTGHGDLAEDLFKPFTKTPLIDLSYKEQLMLRRQSHAYMSNRLNGAVLAKTHTPNVRMENTDLFYPETTRGVIHIIRNPLDIVDSMSDHFGTDYDNAIRMMNNKNQFAQNPHKVFSEEEKMIKQYYSSWAEHAKSWMDFPQYPTLFLKYEDMISDPLTEFTKVATFLNAPFGKAQIEKAIAFSSMKALKKQEKKNKFNEVSKRSKGKKFFRHGKSDRWKELLNESQVNAILEVNAPLMEKLGYDTSGLPKEPMGTE